MKTKILYIFMFLSLFNYGEIIYAQSDLSPNITVEKVIEKAEQYAEKRDIDLKGKFIQKVEYHNNIQNKSEKSYWLVLWINKLVTKGGGVELKLYADGSIEESYHK